METIEALRSKIDSATDMQSVVSAMKVLAVVSIRQFEKSLESLDGYLKAIELGLQAVLMNRPAGISLNPPEPGNRTCALVFGSEQGLSGQFNEQIVSFTIEKLEEMQISKEELTIVALGEHITYRLKGSGIDPESLFPIPSSVKALTKVVQQVFLHLEELRKRHDIDQIMLFYHKPSTGATYQPFSVRLFPVEAEWLDRLAGREWQSRSLPVFTINWRQLFSSLIRQNYFVSLERAFVRSLLSENASRLLSMQVAEKNIEEYLEDLSHDYNNQRQSTITSELLDIVAGSEALREEEDIYSPSLYEAFR